MTTISTLADLDRHLNLHNITATLTAAGRIHLNTTHPPEPIRQWITHHRQLVLDSLAFTCHHCHHEAAVFDTTGTPWCETHMPATDPAIRAAIVTLAALGPLTLEQAAS